MKADVGEKLAGFAAINLQLNLILKTSIKCGETLWIPRLIH